MKVLFIGEGRHDIGDSNPNFGEPRIAKGTVPTLARRVCGKIAGDSLALAWAEIHRFNASAKKTGYRGKIVAAVMLAARKFGCAATVAVADQDGRTERSARLEEGVSRASQLFPSYPACYGIAIESVEAWTLGAPEAIAAVLGVDISLVRAQYPRGAHVESLLNRSGKAEHRPKQLLERIAQLGHMHDCTEFRETVAGRTEIPTLEVACPHGFAPFTAQLRRTVGQAP